MTTFSVLVLGDTQYLFDGERRRPDLLARTYEGAARMVASGVCPPISHVIHVGDVTEHGTEAECAAALPVLIEGQRLLGATTTIACGNHDVDQSTDDQRGRTPFLDAFGPGSPLHSADEIGPGGYSSWQRLGSGVGVLALDWRPSADGWRWAEDILTRHAGIPTIVVSHDVAFERALTRHGRDVATLAERHPQVLLVLGGHEWPSTRVPGVIEYHAVNYQQLPFGGAGAARVYTFDTARGMCDVSSICPALELPEIRRAPVARRELALARDDDQFSFRLPATLGGSDLPWQARGLTLLADLRPDGVQEVELPPLPHCVIEVTATLAAQPVDDWQVIVARLGRAPDGSAEPLAALSCSSERFIGWQAYVDGGETWLTTHELPLGTRVRIIWSNSHAPGLWVDDDPAGRVDANGALPLIEGPWRWRVGAGEWAGELADAFRGQIERVRFWA